MDKIDSKELLETIFLNINHTVIVTNTEGTIHTANPYIEKVLGFSPDDLIGKNLSLIFTQEDLNYLYPNLLKMAGDNNTFKGELILTRKNGTRVYAMLTLYPVLNKDKDEDRLIIFIKDMDDHERKKNIIKKTHYDDLLKLSNGIAHEIRNPLVNIGGYLSRLYKSCRKVNKHDTYYYNIISSLKKIENIIKKVELFAHLPRPSFTRESIKELVEMAIKPYIQEIEDKKIDLSINVGATFLFLDKELFARLLSILIENSLEVLDKRGKIALSGKKRKKFFILSVSDAGSGISDKDLPYIFNPFFSTKPDGAGVDLTIVKQVMEYHYGKVKVISKEGEGTTFSLFFPLEKRSPIRISHIEHKKK